MALLTSGYTLTCEDDTTVGGVSRLFIINRELVDNFVVSTVTDAHAYDDVTTTAEWHEFEFLDYTLNATFENSLADNGTNFVNSTITGFIPRQEKFKAEKLHLAIKSCKLIAIVQNSQGQAFVYGYDEKLKAKAALRAAANGETGSALADRNGYEFRLEGTGWDIPREYLGTLTLSTPNGGTADYTANASAL